MCNVSQVAKPIIAAIVINVVNLVPIWARSNERSHDKAVNLIRRLQTMPAKENLLISKGVITDSKHSSTNNALRAMPAFSKVCKASDSTNVRDFVYLFKLGTIWYTDVLPSLFHRRPPSNEKRRHGDGGTMTTLVNHSSFCRSHHLQFLL